MNTSVNAQNTNTCPHSPSEASTNACPVSDQTVSDHEKMVDALSTFNKSKLKQLLTLRKKPNLDNIPGDNGLPLIGHTLWFGTNMHKWIDGQYKQYGPLFKFNAVAQKVVIMLGADANRMLLQNEDKIFSNYLAFAPTIKNLLDNNVLALDFSHHKSTRKSLQVAFKRSAVEGHIELMNPIFKAGIADWPCDKPVKSMYEVKTLLLETGAKVFLGEDPGPTTEKLNQAFLDLVAGGAAFFRFEKVWFSPYSKALRARKTLEKFVYDNIDSRRKTESRDMFSQLCHAVDSDGKPFSDEDICNQIIFILFAAHDTTTSALSSVFYALASNPEWQEELRQEMFSLDKDDLEFTDIDKLEKTGYTFSEALRMYPPFPFTPRYALKEFEFAGHTIPANTTIMGSSIFTHYSTEYWTNPYQFDPMRFSPERSEDKKDFFQYIPFGGGAHKCLGLHFATVQGRMFLFHFLKQYKISKDPKMKAYKYNNFPLTFPTDGLPLTFTKI